MPKSLGITANKLSKLDVLNDLEPDKFLNALRTFYFHHYKLIPSGKLQMPRQLEICEP